MLGRWARWLFCVALFREGVARLGRSEGSRVVGKEVGLRLGQC